MAASTEREVLVSMRFIIISLTIEMIWVERITQSMKAAVP